MDFAEAIEFLKKFDAFHPKIFKGFLEWGILDTETDGYVVLTDSGSIQESFTNELNNYVKSHKLRTDNVRGYLLVSTGC
jgi:16S rRNA U516 pseudouridylate synthase RsuA-like enzyme